MSPYPQPDCDCIRVVLFRKEAGEVLLEETDDGSALPSVLVSAHSRVAEELTSTIETLWGLSIYCLFDLPDGSDAEQGVRYQVAEARGPAHEVPRAMHWASISSLTDCPNADVAAIQAALEAFDLYRSDTSQGPFGKPGWLPALVDWIADEAAGVGLELTGKLHQLNASPTFSLVRFETNGPALWFKAVGEPNVHEYRITRELASRFPRYLPQLVALRPEWNAWLSVESQGTHLTAASSTGDWEYAAAALAELQIASFGYGLHLIASGCKDVRASSLLDRVDPFFDCLTQLMSAQTRESPPPLRESEIAMLARSVREALEELCESDVPNVLGHLDCNPGNILVSRGHSVFLDWAEGCVGHPFFTFEYLLEHRRKFHGTGHREEALIGTYTDAWKSFLSPQHIAADRQWIPLAAAFAYAARNACMFTAAPRPETASFLRSMTRRMKREADALAPRRHICVS
jgi:Phosphotransferase enzyme family